jgi:hypothetical protein
MQYKPKPITYMEHKVNGQWLFYCYIIPNGLGPTCRNAVAWARKVISDHPNKFRICPPDALDTV